MSEGPASQPLDRLANLGLEGSVASAGMRSARNLTLRRTVVMYPQFCASVREIAHIHSRWKEHGIAKGLLLYGQSGSGKTTVLDYYAKHFPRRATLGVVKIPVLRVVTPESPTVKSLAEAILSAMGDPAASRDSAPTKTTRIKHLFKKCAVELVMLDEFHHFYERRRVAEGKKVSDWLKNLLSECEIPIVLCGLPRSIAALNANSQLRRRFSSPHQLKEFSFTTEDDQLEFRAVLSALEESLPGGGGADIAHPEKARRFYFATAGLIDYVVKILDRVVSDSDLLSWRGNTLPALATAFRKEVWADVPDALNPFMAPAKSLRLLTQVREPFDGWDDPTQYTLSRSAAALAGLSQGQGDDA